MPRNLYEQRQLKFAVGQESLELRAIGNPTSAVGCTSSCRCRIRCSAVSLEIRSRWLESGSLLETPALDVPLVVPLDGRMTAGTATVETDAGIRVDVGVSRGRLRPGSSNRATNEPLRLATVDAAKLLPLAVSLEDHRLLGTTWIDRAWVQTWLTRTARQDRVSYHLTSSAGQLHMTLPEGILPSDVELTLDGKPLSPVTGPQGRIGGAAVERRRAARSLARTALSV